MKVITSAKLLKELEKAGFITSFHPKYKYVNDNADPDPYRVFMHKGTKYEVNYVDGCFCPYVFQVESN